MTKAKNRKMAKVNKYAHIPSFRLTYRCKHSEVRTVKGFKDVIKYYK